MLLLLAGCDLQHEQNRPEKDGTELPSVRLQPEDLSYVGAFRLPAGSNGSDWTWSGEAAAYWPEGDPTGTEDGFPGSLFATGHNWQQWLSEISIPLPGVSPGKNPADLPVATTLQPFHDIRAGLFEWPLEIPRAGLAYMPAQTGQSAGKLYFAWAQHLDEGATHPTHGWADLNLSSPGSAGLWRIGDYWNYITGDYLLEIPESWADRHVSGKRLATGRFRDGGQGAEGPSLIAFAPWREGNPPPSGSTLKAVPLILYDAVDSPTPLSLSGYHHSDEWSGGAWVTSGEKTAAIFVGTKGRGRCWYGFANGVVWPDHPPYPPIPDPPNDERGWWSERFEGLILFYDPADLAEVAAGRQKPNWPQPYAMLAVDHCLFAVQSVNQKNHLGALAYDRERNVLYILEPLADGEKSLVHVWKISG